MAYNLEGRMVEVCTCKSICPCWVGADPDGGACDGAMAWHIDKGEVDGTDVSGLTLGLVTHIPGNVLKGDWKAQAFVDERATQAQEEALLAVFSGQKGGAVADMAQLIGEMVGVVRVPIAFDFKQGNGRLQLGSAVDAETTSFRGINDLPTTLNDSVFSSIPGSPAYVGQASLYKADVPALGIRLELKGHNAVQGQFHFSN